MSNTIKLTGSEMIKVGDKEIKINEIESIEMGDNYRINKVKFKTK